MISGAERSIKWYYRNRAKVGAANSNWRKKNIIWERLKRFGIPISIRMGEARRIEALIEGGLLKCALSGIVLEKFTASPDHIIPRSKGGSDTLDNLRWVHKTVNKMRLNLDDAEFVQWCRLISTGRNRS